MMIRSKDDGKAKEDIEKAHTKGRKFLRKIDAHCRSIRGVGVNKIAAGLM